MPARRLDCQDGAARKHYVPQRVTSILLAMIHADTNWIVNRNRNVNVNCSRFQVPGSGFVCRLRFAFLVLIVLGSMFGTACATRTAGIPVPRPFPGAPAPPNVEPGTKNPEPATRTENTNPEPGTRNLELVPVPVLTTALSFTGVPYRNGGSDPAGFDCSGFVQWVFAQHGMPLPREVKEQWRNGREVDRDEVMPGDLVFFQTVSRGASHVGIALGGDQFVHAPSSNGVVRVERYSSAYWSKRWVGAKRILRLEAIRFSAPPMAAPPPPSARGGPPRPDTPR
jgi:hypothetical protein